MPTYQDVTGRVRAMIGDAPNYYADDNYLLTYVNMAHGQLASELASRGIREAMFRTVMLVPSGTTRVERWPVGPTLPNEIPNSDGFALAPMPVGWAAYLGSAPTVTTGIADPTGGTGAARWSFASGSSRTMFGAGSIVAPALSFFGAVSVWLKTSYATPPVRVLVSAGISDDNGPITETMETVEVAVTSEWQRVFVPFQQKVVTAAPTGDLRRFIGINVVGASPISVDLFRAVIRPTYADTDDTATTGNSSVAASAIPTLPPGMLMPDRLSERSPNSNQQWITMRGPAVVNEVPNAERLLQWDWRNGGIDFNSCRNDREVRMEYWGSFEDAVLGSGVIESELPITGSLEPIAAITAGLVSQARDQHAAAERFGILKEEGGFTGAAGGLVTNLISIFRKAQQSEPVRRRPYFGFARYPGVSGNVIGAWPWNAN